MGGTVIPTILLGRTGDILVLLPALYQKHLQTGEKIPLVVAEEFMEITEACSYIQPIVFRGDFRRIDLAQKAVGGKAVQVAGHKALVAQVYGHGHNPELKLDSFAKDIVRLAGFDGLWRESPKLVLDQRNLEREKKLSSTIKGKFVLAFTDGHSSPFPHESLLIQKIGEWFPDCKIVHNPRAEKFYDLVGLMEKAECIFATDSAPLHLAQAVDTPVVALAANTPSNWHGSPMRRNHVAYTRYDAFPNELEIIKDSLENIGQDRKILHVFSNYPMNEGARKRYELARKTWTGYKLGLPDSALRRGDFGVPFIKDMIRLACMQADEDSILMLHNSDSQFFDPTHEKIIEAVRTKGSCFARRYDYHGEPRVLPRDYKFERYSGSDLFCFTKAWWKANQNDFPDMVIGRECWDRVFRELVQLRGGADVTGEIYHERHTSHWEVDRNSNGNLYNRKLAIDWIVAHKIPLEDLKPYTRVPINKGYKRPNNHPYRTTYRRPK